MEQQTLKMAHQLCCLQDLSISKGHQRQAGAQAGVRQCGCQTMQCQTMHRCSIEHWTLIISFITCWACLYQQGAQRRSQATHRQSTDCPDRHVYIKNSFYRYTAANHLRQLPTRYITSPSPKRWRSVSSPVHRTARQSPAFAMNRCSAPPAMPFLQVHSFQQARITS